MKKKLIISISIFAYSLNAGIFDFQEIQEANRLYNEEKYSDSIKYFENISKVKNSNEANYDLANAEYKSGNYQKAIKSYEKVVTKNSDLEFDKLYNSANSYVKLNDLKKAEELYEKALKLKDDEDAKYNLELIKKMQEEEKQKQENKDKNKEKKKDEEQKKEDKENQQNDKDKEDKNKENQKDEKNQGEKDNKKDEESNSENELDKNQAEASSGENMEQMSDLEEKKWLNRLNEQRVSTLPYEDIKAKDENVKSSW